MNGKPQAASADTGYWTEANVTAESLQGIDLHVATERQKHGESKDVPVNGLPEGSAVLQQMRDKLKTEGGKAVYKMRKQIVEWPLSLRRSLERPTPLEDVTTWLVIAGPIFGSVNAAFQKKQKQHTFDSQSKHVNSDH